jgi:tetratricopeptide (TPR) repeat protein
MAAGDRPGARAAYDKALALDPRSSATRLNLVRLDLAERKLLAARADLWDLFKLDPKNAGALIEAARFEELSGRRGEALRWLELAMADPTEQQSAALYLSDLMLRQHDFERAVKLMKEASSRAPNDVSVLFALSRAQLAAGDLRGARQSLGVLLSVAGFNPNDNVEIARLFFLAGDRDSAYHTVNKALQDTPNFLPALAFLTEVDISGGNFAKAEQQARRIRQELDRLRGALRAAGERIDALARALETGVNPTWGFLFKEGSENSRFGEQVEDYACIYTSRVSNFLAYSPLQYFRSPRDHMPHELV